MSFEINLLSGEKKKLLTGGKYCPEDIVVSAEKPVPVEEKDVNFYDYDGTLLYSYTLAEAQALTELPEGPDWHDELVFDGWNWTLDAVNDLTYQADIGAIYDTVDGAMHLHISIESDALKTVSITLAPYWVGTPQIGYIDWGDGNSVEEVTPSTATEFTHTYQSLGEFVIRIWSENDSIQAGGGSVNLFGGSTDKNGLLRKVFCGTKLKPNNYVFSDCKQLEYATLVSTRSLTHTQFHGCNNLVCAHLSQTNYYAYRACTSLRVVTIANTISVMNSGIFRECKSLKRLRCHQSLRWAEGYHAYTNNALQEARGKTNGAIDSVWGFRDCVSLRKFVFDPESKSASECMFYNCQSLLELDLVKKITMIGAQAFYNCLSMKRLRFNSATPPTVANANAFTNIPTTCVVEVPKGSLEAYQNATNYASIAAQMVEV